MTDDPDLTQAYALTFNTPAGRKVLEDLISRFDPILDTIPPNGEAAMWLAATRRVMGHLRDMTGGNYTDAMARVDGRARRDGERPRVIDRDPERGKLQPRAD